MVERNEEAPSPEGPRSFTRMLESLQDGVLVHEIALEQFKLLKLLFEEAQAGGQGTSSKGQLTLTINYEVGNDQTIDIGVEIKKKEPKKRRNTTTAWVTPSGNVSFSYPRQETLPNVSLVGQAQPARSIAQPAARTLGATVAPAAAPAPDSENQGDQ